MTTLLDLDHRSGWLEGYGAVNAEHARLLVPMAGLRQLYVAEDSGLPLALAPKAQPALYDELPDTPEASREAAETIRPRLLSMLGPRSIVHDTEPGHDPSTTLTAFVETRDQTCLGIGCSHNARNSDKDHETRYPDGPTAAWNLSSKSPRCHHAKHTGWNVHRQDAGPHAGTTTWTSPLGHSYTKPGIWAAPARLPLDIDLPTPRLQPYDDHDPSSLGYPLIPEPKAKPPIPITKTWDDDWSTDDPPF
jgi:hypothetical protein